MGRKEIMIERKREKQKNRKTDGKRKEIICATTT
jgi:hypothetical protein